MYKYYKKFAMMLPYHKTYKPPKNIDWKIWIENQELSVISNNFTTNAKECLKSLIENTNLPEEIWNKIARYIFKYQLIDTHKPPLCPQWMNMLKWLEFWVASKIEQLYNPLLLGSEDCTSVKEVPQKYGAKYVYFDTDIWTALSGKYCFTLYRDGCHIGIEFPQDYDLSNIVNCYLNFNNLQSRAPYIFSKEHSVLLLSDDQKSYRRVWRNPFFKVIPMKILYFVCVTVTFELLDNTKVPEYIVCHNYSSNFNIPTPFCINYGDPAHEMIFADGTCNYRH